MRQRCGAARCGALLGATPIAAGGRITSGSYPAAGGDSGDCASSWWP